MNSCEIPITFRGRPSLLDFEKEPVLVRLSVTPRALEEVLDTLAHLDFPVDPQIAHQVGTVSVEFRASIRQAAEVQNALAHIDSGAELVEIIPVS